MLNIKFIRQHPDTVAHNLLKRKYTIFEDLTPDTPDWAFNSIQRILAKDNEYLSILKSIELIHSEQNKNAEILKNKELENRSSFIEKGRYLKTTEKQLRASLSTVENELNEYLKRLPNLTHPNTHDLNDKLIKTCNISEPLSSVKSHLQLCKELDLVDFQAASKVVGSKFYYLKNDAVLLELALIQYALNVAIKHGFIIHSTPDLAKAEIIEGLGFNPRSTASQIYNIENTNLSLVGTAEITLGGIYADTILDLESLPIKLCGVSHCFRTEAGAAGQEEQGLYRVHQFSKVELFVLCKETDSEKLHEHLLNIEEEIFSNLEIPYRVLEISARDLGAPAYRKFDIEAWMPGKDTFGEVTSASNCTDYQARRLNIRYKDGTDNKFVHTLNATAIAVPRTIIAILENNQTKDGKIIIPKVLQGFMGKSMVCNR